MADIFEEVEEGLREDRYRALFRRYGPAVGAALVAIVLGVAGREAWSAWSEGRAQSSAERYEEALDALQDDGNADAILDGLAGNGAGAYPALAALLEGAAVVGLNEDDLARPLSDDDRARAAAFYDEAASRARDPIVRDAARLKAAYLIADTATFAEIEDRLTPLMEREAPFELAARELYGASALAAGELDKASEAYNIISVSLTAPDGLRRRAGEALAAIESVRGAAAEAAAADNEEG